VRGACSNSYRKCRHPSGAVTTCAPERCGIRTRSSRGCSFEAASTRRRFSLQQADARPVGTPGSLSPAVSWTSLASDSHAELSAPTSRRFRFAEDGLLVYDQGSGDPAVREWLRARTPARAPIRRGVALVRAQYRPSKTPQIEGFFISCSSPVVELVADVRQRWCIDGHSAKLASPKDVCNEDRSGRISSVAFGHLGRTNQLI
jgi:hypothetical protein